MKKMLFKLLAVVLIISNINCISSPVNKKNSIDPVKPPVNNKFIGTWQLCKADSTLITDLNGQPSTAELKILTAETFTVIMVQNTNKVFMGEFSGTYAIKDGLYVESIQFSHPSMTSGVGNNNAFKYEFKNGYWIINGTNNQWNQIWKKIKD